MVDEFNSEQEQIEAIRKWLRTHGPSVAAGIVIGLALIAGWRYYGQYSRDQAEHASRIYDTLLQAAEREDVAQARGEGAVLKDDYADSAYSALAALRLAELAVEENEYATAAEELRWLAGNDDADPYMVAVARLRLARLLLAQGDYGPARDELEKLPEGGAWTAEAEELKGDIYLADNQFEMARTAYQAAQAAAGPGGSSSLLQLKLDNLPVTETTQ